MDMLSASALAARGSPDAIREQLETIEQEL